MKSIKNLVNKVKEMEPKKKVILGGSVLAVVALLTAGGLYIGLNSSDSKTQPSDKKVSHLTAKINKTEKSEDKKEKVEEQKQEEVKVEPMNEIYYAKGQQKMYEKPNNQGNVIGELSDGQAIAITGKTEDNNYQVNWQGATGYMKTDAVQAEEPQQPQPSENDNSSNSGGSSHSNSSNGGGSNKTAGGSSHSSSSNGGSSNGGSSNGGSPSQSGSGSSAPTYSTGWNSSLASKITSSFSRVGTNKIAENGFWSGMNQDMYNKMLSWAEAYVNGSMSAGQVQNNIASLNGTVLNLDGQNLDTVYGSSTVTTSQINTNASSVDISNLYSNIGCPPSGTFLYVRVYDNGNGTSTVYIISADFCV